MIKYVKKTIPLKLIEIDSSCSSWDFSTEING